MLQRAKAVAQAGTTYVEREWITSKTQESRTLSHTQEQCIQAQLAYNPPSESISIPQDKRVTKAKKLQQFTVSFWKNRGNL
jgi:hypothetical protein